MPGSRRWEALVLAAGSSTRLGRVKALVDFGGRPALQRVLDVLRAAGAAGGVVVTGAHGPEIRAAVDPTPLAWAENPDPGSGRMGTIRIGLARLDPAADVLLWPVDRPLASRDTVAALVAADDERGAGEVRVPLAEGRRGHPIVLPASLRDTLMAADNDASLRDLIRTSGVRRRDTEVDDPGIHFDLDTEESVAEAVRWWEARKLERP